MSGSFDLEGLVKWGVGKALDHGTTKTGLPLVELAPHVSEVLKDYWPDAFPRQVEIDPFMMTMGRIVLAGMDRNRKIQEALAAKKDQDAK